MFKMKKSIMMFFFYCFFLLCVFRITESKDTENCESCVPIEKCPLFKDMSTENQKALQLKFACSSTDVTTTTKVPFGFSAVAKGDYVCCNSKVWGVESVGSDSDKSKGNIDGQQSGNLQQFSQDDDYQSGYGNRDRYNRPNFNRQINHNPRQNENRRTGSNQNRQDQRSDNFDGNSFRKENPYYNGRNTNGAAGERGEPGRGKFEGQCPITSFPPSPDSGCCGREATEDSDRITDAQNARKSPSTGTGTNHHYYDPPASPLSWIRYLTGLKDNATHDQTTQNMPVSVDNRITGGSQTDIEQFPWTVLLKTTFTDGMKDSTFSCGGSIISSKYVLTAAHCVYEKGSSVKRVQIYLSEFDKRTFPTDCVGRGRGRRCIQNIVQEADNVVMHSDYDDARLQNDIALIRLRGIAPYTDFIRPICLPPIDIDSNRFNNLPLAVAGWGRDGEYNSDVKQSTVVNLVPQRECRSSYPFLTRRHLCAAGYSGEDTCKGDSGGPLMMVYQGKYFVSGIVSGKRADSRCGTSVPSLYTNVYHYIDWINSNISN